MLKKRKNWLAALVLSVAVGLVGAGCGSTNEPSNNDNSSADKEKVYVVGTDAAYPPFEKMEADGITGFDIDVINAVAEAAGFKVKVEHTGWEPLFDGIEKGTVDLGISAITITDKRKEDYDFSEPYFEAKQLILVKEDASVTKLSDLKGMNIGVQGATTGEEVVKKAFGETYEGIKSYDDTPSAVDDFFNGRVDAVVADNGVLSHYVKETGNTGYKLVDDNSFEKEYYGIMVKKGNTELLELINKGLKEIKDNGKLDEIYNKYFKE